MLEIILNLVKIVTKQMKNTDTRRSILLGWHGGIDFEHPASVGGVISNTCKCLGFKGFSFRIFCDTLNPLISVSKAKRSNSHDGVEVHRVPYFFKIFRPRLRNWIKLIWLSANLAFRKGQLVHIYVNPELVLITILLSRGKRIIFSVHSPPHTWRGGKWRLALNSADLLLVPSVFMKKELSKVFPFAKEKIKVIYNGVNLDLFYPQSKNNSGQRSDRSKVFKIFFAGNLWRVKGVHILIKAASMLSQNGFQIEIAGAFHPDKDMYHYYLKGISKSNIRFLGFLNHTMLSKNFADSDIFIVPSLWREPFGMVIIESMACGTPVIASKIGGIPEIIRHGETGFLIKPGCVRELRERILWCRKNPNALAAMSKNARRRSLDYDWNVISNNLSSIYQEMING